MRLPETSNFNAQGCGGLSTNREGKRVSDRIEIGISIEVVGTDCMGVQFFDRTETLVIGRHGGKLRLERKLAPQQEVTIRCLTTGLEADARVVGQIANQGQVYHYGVKFLDDKSNIWGVEFPPRSESAGAAGGALLECIGCKNRELLYLDEIELEVLETNGQVSHVCKRCRDVTLWKRARTGTLRTDIESLMHVFHVGGRAYWDLVTSELTLEELSATQDPALREQLVDYGIGFVDLESDPNENKRYANDLARRLRGSSFLTVTAGLQ